MSAPSTTLRARIITRWLLSSSARPTAPELDCDTPVLTGNLEDVDAGINEPPAADNVLGALLTDAEVTPCS